MAEKWTLEGDWMDNCNCDSGCPCLFYSDPTQGHCDTMPAFHINKGKYGKVGLDGLNAVMVGRTPGNFWKGGWTGALYLDKRANPSQREALEIIFGGKAGGAPAVLAGLVSTQKGVKFVDIQYDPKKAWVSIPGILEYQLKPTEGGDKKKPIGISNNPFAPAVDPLSMGVAAKGHYKDYDLEFNNTGKDGNWGPFHFAGP